MNVDKWEKLSFPVQMGNIGSEINRVIYWKDNEQEKENALWRALELIDLTLNKRKSRELFRLREVICDLFLGNNIYKVSTDNLKEYFLQFALLSQK